MSSLLPTSSSAAVVAVVALLVTNAITILALWRRSGHHNNNSAPSKTSGMNSETTRSASPTLSAPDLGADDEPSHVDAPSASPRLAAGSSAPTNGVFRSVHTAFAGTKRERTTQRRIECRDTNEYLADVATNKAGHAAESASSSTSAVVPAGFGSSWSNCSVITSVPDLSETGLTLPVWRLWFTDVCASIMARLADDAVAIFYQTDIRVEGRWVSKAQLLMDAARRVSGMGLVWHKIVVVNSLKTARGSTAGYVHLMCFSRSHVEDSAWVTPDLIAHRGAMLWKRAMGLRACEFAVRYVSLHVPSAKTIVDPFCGSGSICAMANAFGLDSIGVDHSRKRCTLANQLTVDKVLTEVEQETNEEATEKSVDAASATTGATDATSSVSLLSPPPPSAFELQRKALKKQRKAARQANQLTQRQWQQLDRDEKRAQMAAAAEPVDR